MTTLTICNLNCGLISPVVPLFPSFPLHSLCPALFFLHSRAEPMCTSRATSSLTVMLNSCLVPFVPCDWGHKKRSWKQVRGEKVVGRGKQNGEGSVPVHLQHWTYETRAMPRKLWAFRRQSCNVCRNSCLGSTDLLI